MRTRGTGRKARGRRVGLVVALAASIPILAPPTADADTKFNMGGGGVSGTAVFDPPGIPASGCAENLSFHLENTIAPAFALNTVITGFLGVVEVGGTGTSVVCGSVSTNTGTLSLSVTGTGPTGSQFDCGPLDGTFTRVGVETAVQITGPCVVNAFGTGNVTFLSTLTFRPTPPGAGVTGPILTADFQGVFTIVPAEG